MAGAELAPVIPLRAPVAGEDELLRLRRAVDLPRLIEVGYDPDAGVICLAADHPVLGYRLCPVAGCAAAVETSGLCHACRLRFGRFQGTFDEFIRSSRCATRCARRSASATRARERVARRDIEEAPPSHGRGIVRSTANPGGLGPLPLRASGSHRSPSQHPHHDTSRVSQPRIVASDQSGSEAVSTRDAHPHAPDPTLHCRPLAVRSRTCSRSYFFFRTPPPCPRTTAPTCRNSAALNSPVRRGALLRQRRTRWAPAFAAPALALAHGRGGSSRPLMSLSVDVSRDTSSSVDAPILDGPTSLATLDPPITSHRPRFPRSFRTALARETAHPPRGTVSQRTVRKAPQSKGKR